MKSFVLGNRLLNFNFPLRPDLSMVCQREKYFRSGMKNHNDSKQTFHVQVTPVWSKGRGKKCLPE